MGARNTPARWGWIAQTLHWATALGVIGLVVVGLYMDDLPVSPTKVKVYALHKSVGLTVLALVVARLIWRFVDKRPPYPPGMPAWQKAISEISHGLLYVMLLVQTLSGWVYNSASNFALQWFGLFQVPRITGPDPELKHLANDVHEAGWILLAALMLLHVAAALHHHFVVRDETLARMTPGVKAPAAKEPSP